KGDHRAQALLGSMLFKGEEVSRQAALGLFWLIVAKDAAKPDEAWITDMYTNALAQANESERAMAHKYLEDWLKKRREGKAVALAPHFREICFGIRRVHGPPFRARVFLHANAGSVSLRLRMKKSLCASTAALALVVASAMLAPAVAADLNIAPIYKAPPAI